MGANSSLGPPSREATTEDAGRAWNAESAPEPTLQEEAPPGTSGYRRALKSLLVYSGGIVAAKLASVILVPLYTHRLTQAEYGTLELLDVTLQAATKLLWGGLPYAFWYFYTNRNTEQERRRVVTTAVLGALAVGSAGALAGSALAPWISELLWGSRRNAALLWILFAGMACAFPFEVMLNWFRVIDEPVKYVASGMGRLVLQVAGAVFLLMVCGLGIAGVLWSSVLAGGAGAAVLLVYGLRRNGMGVDPRLFGRMLVYATPSIFVGLCSFLSHFGDRYFLLRSVSLSELAIYSLAYKFGMLITLMQYAFQAYWNAQVFEIAKRPSSSVLLGRALTYLTLALCGATLAITAFVKPVLRLLAPPAYAACAPLVPLICAAYVAFGLSAYFQTLFYVRKRPGSDAILSGAGALTAGLAYLILIPRYQLWGAATATLLSFAVTLLLGIVWSRRFIHVQCEWGRLSKVVVSAAALAVVCQCLPLHSTVAQVAAGACVLLGYATLLVLTDFLNQSEKRVVHSYLARLRLFAQR